jgi:quercetin dioxygenase-like cupin family protein
MCSDHDHHHHLHPKIRPITAAEKETWPKTVMVPLEAPHLDERGSIQPLVDMPMESCVMISTRKGSVRANHYHRSDWHFCYVVEGVIEYYERPHGSDAEPTKYVINKGELFFTGPMVDHAMVFPVDGVFLTWGRNSRSQDVYEADVVRIPAINP